MANRNRKVLILALLKNRLPEQLFYIEVAGAYVHTIQDEEGIFTILQDNFENIIIQSDVYDIPRYCEYIHMKLKELKFEPKIFQYYEDGLDKHVKLPLYEMVGDDYIPQGMLLDFIQTVIKRPIGGATVPFTKTA